MSQIPKLQFLVMEARDLPAGDKNGFSDPYVILKWKEHKFKTRVIPKTLDPVWNETIELNGIGEHDILEIEVKDKDLFVDDLLGTIQIRLDSLPKVLEYENWFSLAPAKNFNHGGELHVKLSYQNAPWMSFEKPRDKLNQSPIPTSPCITSEFEMQTSKSAFHPFSEGREEVQGFEYPTQIPDDASFLLRGTIVCASNLFTAYGPPNAQCIISCRRKKISTPIIQESSQPEWNYEFVFGEHYDLTLNDQLTLTLIDGDSQSRAIGNASIPLRQVYQQPSMRLSSWISLDHVDDTNHQYRQARQRQPHGEPRILVALVLDWAPRLYVTLHSAQDLTLLDGTHSSNPYCTLSCGIEKKRSLIIEKTLNPSWEQTFIFESHSRLLQQDDLVLVEIWDSSTPNRDDFIGRVEVPIRELKQQEQPNTRWYILKSASGDDAGRVRLTFHIVAPWIDQCLHGTQTEMLKANTRERREEYNQFVYPKDHYSMQENDFREPFNQNIFHKEGQNRQQRGQLSQNEHDEGHVHQVFESSYQYGEHHGLNQATRVHPKSTREDRIGNKHSGFDQRQNTKHPYEYIQQDIQQGDDFSLPTPLLPSFGNGAPAISPFAKPSQPQTKFQFQARHGDINWRKLARVDMDELVATVDVATLQEFVDQLVFCDTQPNNDHRGRRHFKDPRFVQLFRLTQLTAEYLIHSQNDLHRRSMELEEEIQGMEEETAAAALLLRDKVDQVDNLKRELAQKRRTASTYERVLGAKTAPVPPSLPQPTVVPYACPYCPKIFQTLEYLRSHQMRRHSELCDPNIKTKQPVGLTESDVQRVVASETSKIASELTQFLNDKYSREFARLKERDDELERLKAKLLKQSVLKKSEDMQSEVLFKTEQERRTLEMKISSLEESLRSRPQTVHTIQTDNSEKRRIIELEMEVKRLREEREREMEEQRERILREEEERKRKDELERQQAKRRVLLRLFRHHKMRLVAQTWDSWVMWMNEMRELERIKKFEERERELEEMNRRKWEDQRMQEIEKTSTKEHPNFILRNLSDAEVARLIRIYEKERPQISVSLREFMEETDNMLLIEKQCTSTLQRAHPVNFNSRDFLFSAFLVDKPAELLQQYQIAGQNLAVELENFGLASFDTRLNTQSYHDNMVVLEAEHSRTDPEVLQEIHDIQKTLHELGEKYGPYVKRDPIKTNGVASAALKQAMIPVSDRRRHQLEEKEELNRQHSRLMKHLEGGNDINEIITQPTQHSDEAVYRNRHPQLRVDIPETNESDTRDLDPKSMHKNWQSSQTHTDESKNNLETKEPQNHGDLDTPTRKEAIKQLIRDFQSGTPTATARTSPHKSNQLKTDIPVKPFQVDRSHKAETPQNESLSHNTLGTTNSESKEQTNAEVDAGESNDMESKSVLDLTEEIPETIQKRKMPMVVQVGGPKRTVQQERKSGVSIGDAEVASILPSDIPQKNEIESKYPIKPLPSRSSPNIGSSNDLVAEETKSVGKRSLSVSATSEYEYADVYEDDQGFICWPDGTRLTEEEIREHNLQPTIAARNMEVFSEGEEDQDKSSGPESEVSDGERDETSHRQPTLIVSRPRDQTKEVEGIGWTMSPSRARPESKVEELTEIRGFSPISSPAQSRAVHSSFTRGVTDQPRTQPSWQATSRGTSSFVSPLALSMTNQPTNPPISTLQHDDFDDLETEEL